MGHRIWRTVGWAALWIAVIAVGVRMGIDASRVIPDPPPYRAGIGFEWTSDLIDPLGPLYSFARGIALAAPLAVLLTAIHVWRSDARERAGRTRPRIFR